MTQIAPIRLRRLCAVAALSAVLSAPAAMAFEAQGPVTPSAPQGAATPTKPEAPASPKAIVRSQTELMNSGSLDEAGIARALLNRGTAHNELGQYSQALADLTGAIFIGQLDDKNLREAYRQRARAYSATGQTRLSQQDAAKAGSSGSIAAETPRRSPAGDEPDVSSLKLPEFKTTVLPATGDEASATVQEPPATAQVAAEPAAPADKTFDGSSIPAFKTTVIGD